MSRWIKITDETAPNRGVEVLAKKGKEQLVGEVTGGDFDNGFTCEGKAGVIDGITHFKYLD